jgi:hypothetical protein
MLKHNRYGLSYILLCKHSPCSKGTRMKQKHTWKKKAFNDIKMIEMEDKE